jgi:ribonuclease R
LQNPPRNPDRTPPQSELREISRHISDTERNSAEAENETKQIKLFEYLQRVAEMHDPHVFDGLVTDVRPMGLMIEIPDMGIRGVVKREDLPPGRWRLEGHRGAWVSADGMTIAMGMRVPLHVTGLDLEKRFVDFSVAGPPTSKGTLATHPRQSPPAKHRGKPAPKPAAHAGPPRRPQKQAKRKPKRRRH